MVTEEMIEEDVSRGHNKNSFAKSSLLGFLIGIGVIIPGVSGSTIAIIFKLYKHILYSIANLFKKFAKCFMFLLPIIIGAVVGIIAGFFTVRELLNILPFATVLLFIGLMSGSFPGVKDEVKDIKPTAWLWVLFAVGLICPILISCLSSFVIKEQVSSPSILVSEFSIWKALLFLVLGYVVAITQIVPGLSATSIMMSVGYFTPILESVSIEFWKNNPLIFAIYGCLGVGFLVGLFTFSKILTILFKKAKKGTWYVILGLSLGSIASMLISPDMVSIYTSWFNGGTSTSLIILDVVLGAVLCVAGVLVGYSLVRYERNNPQKNKGINSQNPDNSETV